MKKQVFILLIFITINTFSQITGVQFTPDRSYYKSKSDIWYCMTCHTYSYPNHFIKGDTIISGKYYQKVYMNNKSLFDTICFDKTYLMHYNNKKLYLDTNLIYDFSLLVGDTFKLNIGSTTYHPAGVYTYTVSINDSVYIGNKWRKRLTLDKASSVAGLVQLKWVDGIGDINYGFNCNYATAEFAYSYTFNCFSESLTNIFGTDCGINLFCGLAITSGSIIPCSDNYGLINFVLNGGKKPFTYSVQPPVSCGSSFTTSVSSLNKTFSLTCGGSYTFVIRDSSNAFIGSIVKTLNFDSIINLNIYPTKNGFCVGDSTTLSINCVTATYTINPINWSNGATSPTIIVTPTVNTVYTSNGLLTTPSTKTCTAKSSNTITVYPLPIISSSTSQTFICSGETAILTASGAVSYTWYPGVNNDSSIAISPSSTINYTVVGADLKGCVNTSIQQQVVGPCIGIKEYNIKNDLIIYPNPASNILNVSSEENNFLKSRLEIINSLGQTVLQTEFNNQIDVSSLASGFYTLLLKDNSGFIITKKFVKE